MRELSGRTIVITGAARGIGQALARAGHARGMRLVLSDVDASALHELGAELTGRGAEVLEVVSDVSDAVAVEMLAECAYERFSAVHVLVNNAGIVGGGAAWSTSLELYERVIDINLFGVIHGVRSFVGRMLDSGVEAHVVNVASAAGLFTVPGFAAYSASKFAVVGLSEALHHDLTVRKAQIGVSVLCPSWVRTGIAAHEPPPGGAADPIDAATLAAVARAVSQGIAPEDVAKHVFTAIEEKRFYVLTHPSTLSAVRARDEDIALGRPPSAFVVR